MVGTAIIKPSYLGEEKAKMEHNMRSGRKKNDIILRNILNIAKIKPKSKQLQLQLPISSWGSSKKKENPKEDSKQKIRIKSNSVKENDASGKKPNERASEMKIIENEIEQKVRKENVKSNIGESANLNQVAFDTLIQDQFDILSLAVENILSISSENVFNHGARVTEAKSDKNVSSESVSNMKSTSENNTSPLVEDVDFQDVLEKFSQESLSMSQQALSDKCRTVSTLFEGKIWLLYM